MNYLLSILIGYVLGSIPSAYLIVKKLKDKDITSLGSGNVGALNSFQVTNSKLTGVLVLLSDFIKGALSVLLIKYFVSDTYLFMALGTISAIFAHCYTPWLKFKGGRGLATAAGCFLFIVPFAVILWMLLWVIVFILKKDIHTGNILATLLTPVISIVVPEFIAYINFSSQEPDTIVLSTSISVAMAIVFSKHIEPLKAVIKKETINRRKK